MAHAFVRRADGLVMCRLEGEEKAVISQVAQEVGELIRADLGLAEETGAVRRAAASEHPLDRLEAEFAARDPQAPTDPAVRRLFPAASEDPQLAEEMRRLAQPELVDAKLRALGRIPAVLDASGPGRTEVVLDRQDSRAWLTALNDLRLVLGVRLELRTDGDALTLRMLQEIEADAEDLPDPLPEPEHGDPQTAGPDLVLAVYDLLTWLQESLVDALTADLNEGTGGS